MTPLTRVLVAVALVGALAPSTAFGQGGRGGFHVGHSARGGKSFVVKNRIPPAPKSVFPQPVDQWRFWGTPPIVKHHPGVRHPGFVGTNGFIGVPSVGVGVTVPVVNEVVDASTTIIYASPPAMPAPAFGPALAGPSTLPTPTLIEHGDGWYQLRGDGVTQPYSWVYIPKPPTAPPIEVASAPDPSSRPAEARDRGPAYHFTDDRGVTTWTNRLERVPKRFRDQAASTAQPD